MTFRSALPCNGDRAWCHRPYNELAVVCTHNAHSNQEDGFAIPTPNQIPSFTTQLEDGVRCLMLDTYDWNGELFLCHGACGFWGNRPTKASQWCPTSAGARSAGVDFRLSGEHRNWSTTERR